jgi:sterol desaturase/sphingolipid hydroxylase (fatty acid hydroxylase superfamily)
MTNLPNVVAIATPAFIVLVIAEMIAVRLGRTGAYDWRDAATSLTMGLGSTIAGALSATLVVAAYTGLWHFRLFDVPIAWWSAAICLVLDDLAYYWFHRTAHRIRWFWAGHVVHHSSQHYNLTTALRQTWTGFIALSFVFRLPLFLIGFPPALVLFCVGLNLTYQFWIHTETVHRLPWGLESVLNTPSHHRVHHGSNPRYLDRNYAGVFIVWDRLFGTFEPEDAAEPVRYGLVHNLGTFNPLWAAFHEWHGIATDLWRARSWRDRWFIVAGPPGWVSGDTADQIRARWEAERALLPPPTRASSRT